MSSSSAIVNPNKLPSRPKTDFLHYQTDQGVPDLWKKLSAKKKNEYHKIQEKDKLRYNAERDAWKAAGGAKQDVIPKPKGALTSFMIFSKDQKVNEAWNAEPDSVKQLYKEKARLGKEKYNADMKAFLERFEATSLTAPPIPSRPIGAYLRFTLDQRATVKAANPTAGTAEIGKLLGAEWNALPESTKEIYNQKFRADYEQWTKDIDTYESQWGDIKFIKAQRKKANLVAEKEKSKLKEREEREAGREKQKKIREREKVVKTREKQKIRDQNEKERSKKNALKLAEKELSKALVYYKRKNKQAIKDAHPDKTFTEIAIELEEKWNNLSPATRRIHVRNMNAENELAGTVEAKPSVQKAGRKRVVKEKTSEKSSVKKGRTNASGPTPGDLRKGLAFYSNQMRESFKKKNSTMKASEINIALKEQFTSLKKATQANWIRKALSPPVETTNEVA